MDLSPAITSLARRRWLLAPVALIALVVAVYWPVGRSGFLNLDDDAYVEHQPLVNQGLRGPAIVWAFTGTHSNNWHPLTTLSHALDCTLFGPKPAPMHWENVAWHAANSILVLFVLHALTGRFWRSSLVAALFAIHPLHVESVAWISERKDVLSAFFWLLGLWSYARYVKDRSLARYLTVAATMILALLSKPMAVTFPCTLLLLDFWPLRRWPARSWSALVVEKLPLFALVALHGLVTFVVQHSTGAANFGERFPLDARLGNAVVAYARYFGKTFWPDTLAPMYFHPGYWPTPAIAAAASLLCALAVFAWSQRVRRPWIAFGWLWFVGTLVPVIGLVQVGAQSMADRYMYLPIVGVLIPVVWFVADLSGHSTASRRIAPIAAAALVAALAFSAFRQVGTWRDNFTLYRQSIAAGEDNAALRFLLGTALLAAGRPDAEAEQQYRRALELEPDYVNAFTQLALLALKQGRTDEATRLIEQSLRCEPGNPGLHVNRGALAVRLKRVDEAIPHFERALQLDPGNVAAHYELGQILVGRNQLEEASKHYRARATLDRWNPQALFDYGTLSANLGRLAEAQLHLRRALWLQPEFPQARTNLAAVDGLLSRR